MQNTIKQSKLWVYVTAFIMSFNGGYINSICLVSILKNAVGYVTGNLTLIGDYFEQGQTLLSFHLLGLVICFFFGCILSGLLIKGQNLERDRRYNLSLLFQLSLVLLSIILIYFNFFEAAYMLAITMGMQNAMTTHYGSALIRTTHMTGTTTDLGILVARWIKGYAVDSWKFILYLSLIVGFLFGSIAGAMLYSWLHIFALFTSVFIYILMLLL